MEKAQTFTATLEDAGKRLDMYLTEQLANITRSQVKKLIKSGGVLINQKSVSVHQFLKEGDQIVVAQDATRPFTDIPGEEKQVANQEVASTKQLPPLHIIEETETFLVIDKPAGILVHPDTKNTSGTLIDMLINHDPSLGKIGEDPMRPAIVHRLDKDVSGLMLVAKTQDAYDYFKHLFKEKRIKKTYLAFVYGELPQQEGDIRFRIARSNTSPRMAARPQQEDAGRAAWTHYRVIERFRGATLVEAEIISGRTHQIRAHFFALNCPIIGDVLYQAKHPTRTITAPRLMLQSVGLEFTDPVTDDEHTYVLAPDPSFETLKNELS